MTQQRPSVDTTAFELPPSEDWFLEVAGPNQETLVYFRFQATGMLARRVGPFHSREAAAVWFSKLVRKVRQAVDLDLFNEINDQVMTLPWNHRGECVFLEDPFTFRPGPLKKTQPKTSPSQSKPKVKKSTISKRKAA